MNNGIRFTHHKNNPGGAPDYWKVEADGIGPTKRDALEELERAVARAEEGPPPDAAADIYDLTARVAALETECAELRRLLSGAVPMRPRPAMPPGTYYDPPAPPATGPGWPVNPSPVQPLMPPPPPLGGYPIVTCGETGAATK